MEKRSLENMLQSHLIVLGKVLFVQQRLMCRFIVVQKKPAVSCPFFPDFLLTTSLK
jgi:hypothetical protein